MTATTITGRTTWVAWAVPWAVEASRRTGLHWETVIAQWACETAWGSSPMFRQSRNFAGIKRSKLTPDAPVRPGGTFRHYASYTEALEDYVRVISLHYYDHVRTPGLTAEEQCRALGNSPYAQEPGRTGGYRGNSRTNEAGHALLVLLPTVRGVAPIGPRIDETPVR